MGFCRTNLFKRLESSGEAFQQSIERHILRNYIFLHAIKGGHPVPIGTQDAGLLDAGNYDEDADDPNATAELFDEENSEQGDTPPTRTLRTEADFTKRAAEIYQLYAREFKSRFKWLRPDLFVPSLAKDLAADAASLLGMLTRCGDWNPNGDAKLEALCTLLKDGTPRRRLSSSRSSLTLCVILKRSSAREGYGVSQASPATLMIRLSTRGGSAPRATTSATGFGPSRSFASS